MTTPPGISKQLTDKVLEIVKDNKNISLEDIVLEMKKSVGLGYSALEKIVNEILEWYEEGGVILRMVGKRSGNAEFRMNENTQVAKDIIDEALSELGISKTPEESLTEAINPRTIDPKGWYGIYTHERLKQKIVVGPYPSKKEAYHDYDGDIAYWDDIFMGAELIKRLNKGEYKDFTLKAIARGYRKVKDLDGTKSLWELRTLYGMSYLVVSYSPQVDETAVFKADKNGKILSYSEVYSTGGKLEPEPIVRDIASGKIKPMNEDVMEGAKEIHKKLLQKGVVAPIDKERHPERKGLEGPFRHKKSGKVFYYDPKEGKYYDADSDVYMDVDDVMEETLDENRRLERFIQTFYKIHPKINLHGMSKDELEKIADKAMKQGDGGSKSLVLLKTFLKKAGATEMFGESIDESVVAKKSEKFKAGIPKWFHTAFTGMPKYPTQLIAGWKTELKTGSGMPGYMTYVLHYDGVGTYTVYRGDGYKVKIRGDKPLGKFRSPEEAMDFVQKEVMNENTEVRGSFQHIKKILGN